MVHEVTRHPIISTMRSALFGAGATVVLAAMAHAQINDSIRGAPSEANHFIETPNGWVHPKTPWGEPDIAANLNMMQAAGVPLERCASSYRPGAPPCDMNKKWLTEAGIQRARRDGAQPGRPQPTVDRGRAISAARCSPA